MDGSQAFTGAPQALRVLLRAGADRLLHVSRSEAVNAQLDAQLLLRHVLGKDRAWMLAHPEAPVTAEQRCAFDALIARRLRHEPVQYILGTQDFYGLPFHVTPAVLIPRPETEHLVEAVLAQLSHDQPVRIVDVGTGSGAIACALAQHLPHARIEAVDLSPAALVVASANVKALGLLGRITLVTSDLLAHAAQHSYNCIVSNPPYVAAGEVLEPQVAEWEPHTALFAGEQGLSIYERLIPQALDALLPGGLLALEMGAGQQQAIEQLFAAAPRRAWTERLYLPDLQGIPRVVLARTLKPGEKQATLSTDHSSSHHYV